MNIKISTLVGADLNQVKEGFTEDLFLKLNPPFPPVELLRFDGCKKNDVVALELNFFVFKQYWISLITKDFSNENEWYFVDKGVKLPFFLKRWKHHHGVKSSEKGALIVDDITYSTGIIISDLLIYPLLYFQFLYRKPFYKKIFR
ncbi:SRPBCC family protein [Ekhidna sp.]|uniref:SRPBCC family protein n=1 Tax=Ekhidna sp. TaxID=2608089 RepID=UPI003B5031CF